MSALQPDFFGPATSAVERRSDHIVALDRDRLHATSAQQMPWPDLLSIIREDNAFRFAKDLLPPLEGAGLWAEFDAEMDRLYAIMNDGKELDNGADQTSNLCAFRAIHSLACRDGAFGLELRLRCIVGSPFRHGAYAMAGEAGRPSPKPQRVCAAPVPMLSPGAQSVLPPAVPSTAAATAAATTGHVPKRALGIQVPGIRSIADPRSGGSTAVYRRVVRGVGPVADMRFAGPDAIAGHCPGPRLVLSIIRTVAAENGGVRDTHVKRERNRDYSSHDL